MNELGSLYTGRVEQTVLFNNNGSSKTLGAIITILMTGLRVCGTNEARLIRNNAREQLKRFKVLARDNTDDDPSAEMTDPIRAVNPDECPSTSPGSGSFVLMSIVFALVAALLALYFMSGKGSVGQLYERRQLNN